MLFHFCLAPFLVFPYAFMSYPVPPNQAYLNKFAYTDGTTFFLPRDDVQQKDKHRAAIGRKVWRRTSGEDSLEDKNVGPSTYAKAQGSPVKIWGLWGDGHLEYMLLPEVQNKGKMRSANMTGDRYEDMVEKYFPVWKKKMFPRMGGTQIPLVKERQSDRPHA